MLKVEGDGDGIETNDLRSSWKLPRSRRGAVIDADSLVTEELLLLRMEDDPISNPPGDFPNMRDEPRLCIRLPMSRDSTCEVLCG